MKKISDIFLYITLATLLPASCADSGWLDGDGERQKIELSGDIEQIAVTRANDSGFADGDVMGVYVVDYNGSSAGSLQVSGNRADNVRHTFDEANRKWIPAYDIYWKDKHTHIDVYGYYPCGNPESIGQYPFTVQRDQSTAGAGGDMGGYEASDFLWGKAEDVAPTTSVVRLTMYHRMACARVTLVEGSGFAEGEWAATEKQVLVANLVREASINLADGTVRTNGGVEQTATIPAKTGDEWRAIAVPQTVEAGTTMFSITIGGVPYKFSKNEAFTYTAGKISNFAIRVDKKAAEGKYALTVISESITAWENDLVSHDATAREYVIIHSTAGHLKEAITAAGKDYTKLKNLKITGQINRTDFYFMRDEMSLLQALNLKEVRIKSDGRSDVYNPSYPDDQIPGCAFFWSSTMQGKDLVRLVLPDTLKSIGDHAFYGCKYLSGSLIIPEGVEEIQMGAFNNCTGLNGTLSLPTTLKYLGTNGNGANKETADEGNDYYGGVFQNCSGLVGELILPDNLELIRGYCFSGCNGLTGELRLPNKLRRLGNCAFSGCEGFTGSLSVPQGIQTIPSEAFNGCGFDGTLQLHDGITNIGNNAFSGCHFKGELVLPRHLSVIASEAFYANDFSGVLKIPSGVTAIGKKAFAYNWRLMGVLEFPDGLESIGAGAFAQCRMLEGLVFPESMETIRSDNDWDAGAQGAFQNCYGIGSIVCKGDMPPTIYAKTFDGVAKDNFTLEVPASAVQQYQAAAGWCDFKCIAAHHELVCRPSVACAVNTEHRQTLVIDAEGEWEVAGKPDWCELSQTSGNGKTELTLTIKEMPQGAADRNGEIVFRLAGKDYTHKCAVSQYNYRYAEDQWLALQKAAKGNNGGINIVIVGDGYDAKEIASGQYLKDMQDGMEHFFGIEPYKTYRDYFNVSTAFPVSTESGVGSVNTIRYNRFNTTFTGGAGLKCDYDEMFGYVLNAPTVNTDNLCQTLVIVIPNSTDYGGITMMWEDGSAIAFCPKSTYGYPLDTRGVIQHEAGGHGFGKLGDEYIYHNAFIDACGCACCGHTEAVTAAQSLGWYQNISVTGKMHQMPWAHLIFDNRYSDIVDIFEGAFMHSRGVYRSEQNSCMNNDIPYYSTISREAIVKRIKQYAGETYSFEDFVKNDKRDAGTATRAAAPWTGYAAGGHRHAPQVMKGSPLASKRLKVRERKNKRR
ncbi:MAG: leucine-rich repeat protein [Prevotella sp.]|nr:leucine-rich repeat protein [Prevotella sp.]